MIDDDPSMREALEGLLETIAVDIEPYESAEQFLKAKRRDVPTCIVLDVRLPGLSGLDIQRELRKAHIPIPIIFITGHGDIPMSVRAIKEGAVEFLTKPFREQDLLDAIRTALNRDRSRREQEKGLGDLKARFGSLTTRERQVMALAVSGRVSKQIAAEIGINEVTVRVHRGQAMRKLGARSLAELIRIADKLSSVDGDKDTF